MNIVKGISALVVVAVCIITTALVFVTLSNNFGPWVYWLVPISFLGGFGYGFAEAWIKDQSIASIERGLKQSAEGKTHDLGSFAKYADSDCEEIKEDNEKLRQGVLEAYQALSNLNGEIPVEAWKKLYGPMKILRMAYNEPILTEVKDD